MPDWTWNALTALGTMAVPVITVLVLHGKSTARYAKMELKIDTLWDFQMRRGMVEATHKGWGEIQNPFIVSDQALSYFEKLRPELEGWFAALTPEKRGLRELVIGIEQYFGNRIVKEICVPYGVSHAACNLMAAAVASGVHRIEFPPETSVKGA